MDLKLDSELCSKYPELYCDRHGDMRNTAMVWGFETGAGWYTLIDKLSAQLTLIRKLSGIKMVATQVKEKYGTLHYYIGNEWHKPTTKFGWFIERYVWRWSNFKYQIIKRLFPAYIIRREIQNQIWNDIIDACISAATSKSRVTCEVCGEYGCMNHGNWLMVRCSKHWEGPGTYDDPDEEHDADNKEDVLRMSQTDSTTGTGSGSAGVDKG